MFFTTTHRTQTFPGEFVLNSSILLRKFACSFIVRESDKQIAYPQNQQSNTVRPVLSRFINHQSHSNQPQRNVEQHEPLGPKPIERVQPQFRQQNTQQRPFPAKNVQQR